MASGGAGSGGGGMEVLGTLMVASLAGGGPWGAFPPVEFGLRIGRGFGGMSEDEHRRDGGNSAEIKAEFGQGGVVAYCYLAPE